MRHLKLVAAALSTLLALVLVALALDVLVVSRAVTADDLRFQTASIRQRGLWEGAGYLPGSIAVRGLGLEDDLAYRQTVSLFARAQPHRVAVVGPGIESLRGDTELELTRTSRAESDPRRRSQLLNFLGVMPLGRVNQDFEDRASALGTAIGFFQSALRIDPENSDAKLNLELVLREVGAAGEPPAANDPSGEAAGGPRSSPGGVAGAGY